MTRPNAAVALESAAKARAEMQAAQQRGAQRGAPAAPTQARAPVAAAKPGGPQGPMPRQYPNPEWQPKGQPGRAQYPNPEWSPRAEAVKGLMQAAPKPALGGVALPAGYAPPQGPVGNPMASMGFQGGNAGYAPSGGFVPPAVPVQLPPQSPLSDPGQWQDVTGQYAGYASPQEQAAKQQQIQQAQYEIETYYGGDAGAYYADKVELAQTPEEKAAAQAAYQEFALGQIAGADFDEAELLAGLMPEGWSDTAALAGMDESEWENEANPGPGFKWDAASGKWVSDPMPPGISADDARWDYDYETGKWSLVPVEEEPALDKAEFDQYLEQAIDSDVSAYMNPNLDKQKKEAWDQAQAANYEMAQALGSRGIGASGLAGMGMGDVFAATQANVQGLEFDEYTRAAELRLNEIRTLMQARAGDMTAEQQQKLADEAAKLEKELAEMQYAQEDEGDIWQMVDNMAAIYEKLAPEGWGEGQAEAFAAWVSQGNNPFDAKLVPGADGKLRFDLAQSGPYTSQEKENQFGPPNAVNYGGYDPQEGGIPGDSTYEEYLAMVPDGAAPMTPTAYRQWQIQHGFIEPTSGGSAGGIPEQDQYTGEYEV